MRISDPKAFINTLPDDPGVYQMQNVQGKVIYVGKARNLKKRISSYFYKSLDTKTQAMMAQVHTMQVTITRNENEALLLEANYIKQFQPRYNVLLRDDKSYPYLYLATHQKFPRLDFFRGSKKMPGRYFGPYPNAGSVRENLALVQKLFQLRQCTDSFFKNRTKPCLQYQIKRCTAPCVGYIDEENYRQQVQNAILFFEGKNNEIMNKLVEQMEIASKKLAYEKAAYYRDQIQRLRRLQKQQVITAGKGNIDVISAVELQGEIGFSILFIRSGRIIGDKAFFPRMPRGIDLPTAIAEFIPQYYLSPLRRGDIPERIITSEELNDRLWIQRALVSSLNRKLLINHLERQPYKQWLQMATLNAKQTLSQHISRTNTFATKFEALQKVLALPNPISRIECFDISHALGESTVGACVTFDEKGPVKKDYRRFNIHEVTPGDDYAALRQALTRRYTRVKAAGEGVLPDLLMIDGGVGQLRQAASVFEELQISGVFLLAIAKGKERKPGLEKLFIWGQRTQISLSPDSIAFHLLQQIRDEAHRFAITAHQTQRIKRRTQSSLEGISGIGPRRRRELLKYFGGLQELQRATIEEIEKVPGINKKLAKLIYNRLHLTSR